MQNVEKATSEHAERHPVKVKLTLTVLETPFLEPILTFDAVFEHIFLHLILCDYLSATEVKNLNKTGEAFNRFYGMLLDVEPNIVIKLFQYDPDYESQTTAPIERRLQLLFLTVMHIMHVP